MTAATCPFHFGLPVARRGPIIRDMSRTGWVFDEPVAEVVPRDRRPVLRGLGLVLLLFASTRLAVWVATYSGAVMFFRVRHAIEQVAGPRQADLLARVADPQRPEHATYRDYLADFGPLAKFDGQHYKSIVVDGYHYVPASSRDHFSARAQNIAYFPLYPLVSRPPARLMSPQVALVLVAHICALVAVVLFYLWVRRRVDEPAALFGVAAILCWPAACYYSFGYAESLTLLLTVATLRALDRRAFIWAAVLCGLATATRPTAAALVPVYLLAFWCLHPASRGRRLALLAPLTFVAALGGIVYAGYLAYRFDSPLVYVTNFRAGWTPDEARSDWLSFVTLTPVWEQFKYFGRALAAPPISLTYLAVPFTWNVPLSLFVVVLSLAAMRRVPPTFRPLLWLGPLIFAQAYVASGGADFGVAPLARYTALAVPTYVVLAAWCTRAWRPAARHGFLAFLLVLQLAWAFRVGLGEWSG